MVVARGCVGLLGLALLGSFVPAADAPKAQPRVALAKLLSPSGSVIARKQGADKFEVVKQGDGLYSGDMLVALPGATIGSKNGFVELRMHADLDHLSPYPILESAIILHANDKADLDFTLDRGRVDLLDNRDDGSSHIVVRFWGEKWEWTTGVKKARVALEIYGRWPRGAYFHKEDNPQPSPIGALAMVVLYGEVSFEHGGQMMRMIAPPGPALYQWDSASGGDPSPTRLEKVPAWADLDNKPSVEAKKRAALIDLLRTLYAREGVGTAIGQALNSNDRTFRSIGVVSMGATDDLPGLIDALANAEHPEVREVAVRALRHWIGRTQGQDLKLYNALQKKGYSPAHAEMIVNLLHTPGPTELSRASLYEALIAYLGHEKPAIRELAAWHLYRLVPAGKDIAYDPAASKADRDAAIKKWQELIPEGKLPPKVAKDIKEFKD
jgi:hypothetical protein